MVGMRFQRRGFNASRFSRPQMKMAIRTKNHYEANFNLGIATTDQIFTLATGVDAATNRSTHIPNGATLRAVTVTLAGTTLVAGKHQCLLYFEPGGSGAIATPITSYWSGTDPLPEDSIDIRRNMMGRVDTVQKVTGALTPIQMRCVWRGRKLIRQDDVINLCLIKNSVSTLAYDAQIWLTFEN